MPRARYLKMEPARRGRLLEAAAREFAAYGYDAASVNAILDEAGFSKGSFYYYFDDKADLAGVVLLSAWEGPLSVLRTTRAPAEVKEFWHEVQRVQQLMLEQVEGNPLTYGLLMRLGGAVASDDQLALTLGPVMAEARRLMTSLWSHGQSIGAVRQDLPAAEVLALVEALKRAAWQARVEPQQVPTRQQLEHFVTHLLDLVRRVSEPRA